MNCTLLMCHLSFMDVVLGAYPDTPTAKLVAGMRAAELKQVWEDRPEQDAKLRRKIREWIEAYADGFAYPEELYIVEMKNGIPTGKQVLYTSEKEWR